MQNDEINLIADEARYCSWGDTAHYNEPIRRFERCDGQFLFDDQGNGYFDLQMQNASANFGYRNAHFLAAATDQMSRLPQVAAEYPSAEKIQLSKAIAYACDVRWQVAGRVHFNVGGAQAIDDSLKLVAKYSGTRRAIAFEGSYHGRTIGASTITASYRYRANFGSFGNRAQFVPFPYCFRCPFGKKRDSCALECVKQITRLFESECQAVVDPRTGSTEFGALYIEPVQGTGGYIIPPPGYFEALVPVLRDHKLLIVVDEVQMGFFRTGRLWSIEHFNVRPDILVFGKSLTNGLNPLSGLWANETLIAPEVFPPGSTHSTFGSNPLGCRLGLASFEWMAQHDYATTVTEIGTYFLDGLRELKGRHVEVGDVDGLGLALRLEICEADGFTPNPALAKKIRQLAFEMPIATDLGPMRLILGVGGHHKNVFCLSPCLEFSRTDADRAIAMLDVLITEAKGS